ncbi:energy transducer TonB [Chitinophagaceae bacterium LWZ2-11]
MDTKKILSADVLDIIFDGRNKDYGAYDLRKTYNKRIATALLIMLAVCLCSGISYALTKTKKDAKGPLTVEDISLAKVDIPEEKKIELPPPPPPPKQEVPKVEITQFTPPVIVQDKDVTAPPPDVDKLADTKIGTFDQDGDKDNGLVAPPPVITDKGTGVIDKPKLDDVDGTGTYRTVQIEAEFPGGKEAWRKYLERNLNNTLPSENGAAVGLYSVDLSFVVDKEGNISDIQVEHDPGFGTKEEAIRILKKSPKWNAAIQNGRKVAYRARQRISFRVEGE